MSSGSVRGRLVALLEPVVASVGLDLEDVVVTPAGKRRLLRIVVDRDGGVSLDDVADVSRAVSETLDARDPAGHGDGGEAADPMGGAPYVLEVSSPGVDRPLTQPRHWRRVVGRLVTATLRERGAVTGRLLAADETAVTIDVAGAASSYRMDEVVRGMVQVEFSRPGVGEQNQDEEEAPA